MKPVAYQQPLIESLILTCLTLLLLAFTGNFILSLYQILSNQPLELAPAPVQATAIAFSLWSSYSIIMLLSRRFLLTVFLPQFSSSTLHTIQALLLGAAVAVLVSWLSGLFPAPQSVDNRFDMLLNADWFSQTLLFISAVILAPIGEEYLFRGLLLAGLQQRFSTFSAILLSSVVFMAFHLLEYQGYWFALTAIFCLGILLAAIRLHSRSLLVPVVCHSSYNLIILTLA